MAHSLPQPVMVILLLFPVTGVGRAGGGGNCGWVAVLGKILSSSNSPQKDLVLFGLCVRCDAGDTV